MAEFFGATNARIDRLMKMYPAYRELLPYEGMTVAIDKKHMPNESELSGWFLLDRDETEVEEKLAGGPRGRPRKQEEAAEAFEIRFPDGRGGYTWKEVTRILEEEMQIFVSIETLKSGLAASKNSENDTK